MGLFRAVWAFVRCLLASRAVLAAENLVWWSSDPCQVPVGVAFGLLRARCEM